MDGKTRMISKVFIVAVICALVFTAASHAMMRGMDTRGGDVPEVRLISPDTETVDLGGKKEMEFKWSPFEGSRMLRRCYDFRLYKGRDTLESTLIFKKEAGQSDSSLSLPADMFENGGTYTWTMRQVYDDSRKSRRTYQAFTVTK